MRYYCSDKSSTSIVDIKEPASCSYIFYVQTPLICKHPLFTPKKEKHQSIYCAPLEPKINSNEYPESEIEADTRDFSDRIPVVDENNRGRSKYFFFWSD